MENIEIYTRPGCGYCVAAKKLFDNRGLKYVEYDVTKDQRYLPEMLERATKRTFPQIFINNESVGGFDDLISLHEQKRA